MPGGAFANYLTIAFLILVLIGMLFNKETVVSVVIVCVFLAVVTLYYFVRYNKKDQQAKSDINSEKPKRLRIIAI